MVNKRDAEVSIVCLSCHFDVGIVSMLSGKRYPIVVLDDTCMLIMTRTCLGPKSSSMRFGYSYSQDVRFSTYDLSSICLIFVLAFTLNHSRCL
jgi:hypothetical protein